MTTDFPQTVYLAELDTLHYSFRAIGSTPEQARDALRLALVAHASDRDLKPDWADRDDINTYEMTVDAPGTRDGMRIQP